MFSFVLSLWMLAACKGDVEESDDASTDSTWEEMTVGDGSDSKDDTGKSDEETCGDGIVAGESCEGSLDDTLCVDADGVWWWCEDNVWVYKEE